VLTIRDEQLRILRLGMDRSLEDGLIQRFAYEYPEDYLSLGESRALEFVRDTIRSAAQRNIVSQEAVTGLLKLHVEFGRELERAPYRQWANSILDHAKLPGALKVNLVSGRLFGITQGRRVVLHRVEG
jgi:hypothetical protein